jgi:hypothetical protein
VGALLVLVGVELEVHEFENKVVVGFDVVNVTGTVTVTATVFVDVAAGEHISFGSSTTLFTHQDG